MPPTSSMRDRRTARTGLFGGIAMVVLVGQLLLLPLGDELARWSYDLPFLWTGREVPEDVVMVYLDPKVKTNLGQPPDAPLHRRFYADLLDKLTADRARLVLFDIIFDSPHADAETDAQFAAAMRRHGQVVLVGYTVKQFGENTFTTAPVPPTEVLANAAVGWGMAEISPDAADQRVRRVDVGVEDSPSVSLVAARLLNPALTNHSYGQKMDRWLNYYCEPAQLKAVTLDHALLENGLDAGFFRNKIVLIGARPGSGGLAGAEREEFPTPYSRFGGSNASGPSIHALSLLNLQRGDWLKRLGPVQHAGIALLWGVFIALLFSKLNPVRAIVAAPIAFGLVALLAVLLQARLQLWFNWLVPAAAQTSVALVWSVGFQYALETRRRRKLRRAFAVYLSPYMADQIANSEFDLALGGKEVEATIMFTDLEGFTNMSETLPPAEISWILTSYFNETTRAILKQDGTIIKYIGDAVLAMWGTPLAEPRHTERAVLAAWEMLESGQKEIAGRTLRTRIGINTGLVLAGNLGSDFRFDFTAIGNTVNTAARLEALNKYFGTSLLIGEATKADLSNRILTRSIGAVVLAGKTQPIIVHEVLGVNPSGAEEFPWSKTFAAALGKFTGGRLDEAEQLFRETINRRGQDGPSEFYLKQIADARLNPVSPPDRPWDGVIVMSSK
ncbi:MAG: adenylate/guanylate cyclase domain-containing protein [Akkermansiaceae bacterium]|nr:adenylate/guanylate cyclase domain-containing protein [Verrucomicrobiales bacterium]